MHPIRIGMVGLGIMGRRYYRMLQELEGVEVTALCVRHLDTIQDLPGQNLPTTACCVPRGRSMRCSLPHRTIAILRSPSSGAALGAGATCALGRLDVCSVSCVPCLP
jgi:hypothetical protein